MEPMTETSRHTDRPHGRRRPPRREGPYDREPLPPEQQTEDPERLSRFLALVLRHRAYQFDLRVDDEGFVRLDELMRVMHEQRNLGWVEHKHIDALLSGQERTRFEVRDGNIRATYGHSFNRPVRYEPIDPPEHLFLGVPRGKVADLRTSGVKPSGRQYVHLSANKDDALQIAKQQDPEATLVTVLAQEAARSGIPFHLPAEGIYLAARVPPEFLEVEVHYGRALKKSKRRP